MCFLSFGNESAFVAVIFTFSLLSSYALLNFPFPPPSACSFSLRTQRCAAVALTLPLVINCPILTMLGFVKVEFTIH